jgi:hypothetical protein
MPATSGRGRPATRRSYSGCNVRTPTPFTARTVAIGGVIVGTLASDVAVYVLRVPLLLAIASNAGVLNAPANRAQFVVTAVLAANPALVALDLALLFAGVAFGGYIAARAAKGFEFLDATVSALLFVGCSLYWHPFRSIQDVTSMSWPIQALYVAISLAAGLTGAYLRGLQTRGPSPEPAA